jgi:hypothetical protein
MAQLPSSPKEASLTTPSPAVHDPTIEKAIQKAIDGIHYFLNPSNMTPEEQKEKAVIKISEATRKYCELQIRTLQDAPRDPDKLRELLKRKQRRYEKATLADEMHPLVTEIEMLKFVQFLVNRNASSTATVE